MYPSTAFACSLIHYFTFPVLHCSPSLPPSLSLSASLLDMSIHSICVYNIYILYLLYYTMLYYVLLDLVILYHSEPYYILSYYIKFNSIVLNCNRLF